MKISCNIVVINRTCISQTTCGKSRSIRSSLGIGKCHGKSNSSDGSNIFILHCTAQNKSGTKYKIVSNIERIFKKFLAEGKATISFTTPPHDLQISCDSTLLKSFITLVETARKDPGSCKLTSYLGPATKSQVTKPTTKLIVTKGSELPVLGGYPRTLEHLEIQGLALNKMDLRITQLPCLRVLDLSNNRIKHIPPEIGSLPNLNSLCLANNLLGEVTGQPNPWKWLSGKVLKKTLKILDLSNNQLMFVPKALRNLVSLRHLVLKDNPLSELPDVFLKMKDLRKLNVAGTEVNCFPHPLYIIKLEEIWISNCTVNRQSGSSRYHFEPNARTLLELAAQCIIKERIVVTEEDLPQNLLDFLDSSRYCNLCSNIAFVGCGEKILRVDPSMLANVVNFTSFNVDCVFIKVPVCNVCKVLQIFDSFER